MLLLGIHSFIIPKNPTLTLGPQKIIPTIPTRTLPIRAPGRKAHTTFAAPNMQGVLTDQTGTALKLRHLILGDLVAIFGLRFEWLANKWYQFAVSQSTTISMIQQDHRIAPLYLLEVSLTRPPHPPCCNPWSRYHLTVRKDLPPTPQGQQLPSRHKLLKIQRNTPKKTVDRLVVYWKYPIFQVIGLNKYIPGGFFRMSAPMLSFSNTWVGKSHPLFTANGHEGELVTAQVTEQKTW